MIDFFLRIVPLFLLILLGFGAGKAYKIDTARFGSLVAFTISPIVTFGAILNIEFKTELLILPLTVMAVSCVAAAIGLYFAKKILPAPLPNLAAMSSTNANTGFFGLPVFLIFMPINMTGIYILANLGIQLVETVFGYYIGARGENSIMDSLKKVAKLPPLWAALLALICNMLGVTMHEIAFEYWEKILHTWIITGMMMIGIALSTCPSLRPDVTFCSFVIFMRNIIWPILMAFVIWCDITFFQIFDASIYFIFTIFALSPMAGNTVAFAATLKLHPDKIAFAVVLSTILTVLTMPLYIHKLFDFIMAL